MRSQTMAKCPAALVYSAGLRAETLDGDPSLVETYLVDVSLIRVRDNWSSRPTHGESLPTFCLHMHTSLHVKGCCSRAGLPPAQPKQGKIARVLGILWPLVRSHWPKGQKSQMGVK